MILEVRFALFWDITQSRVEIFNDVSVQRILLLFLNFLTHEDGTDTLSRNVGKGLTLDAA
jgi:hypothetical protein